MSAIGTLNEKSLHASLKVWYAKPKDKLEVKVGKYFIDIVRKDLLLEIQTRNFSSIKTKLKNLLDDHKIHLIYPIAEEKWIIKLPKNKKDTLTRRKSPKRGKILDMFKELVSIPDLMLNPNFSFEVLLIQEEEVIRHQKNRNWRRKGWVTEERHLLEVKSRTIFKKQKDWLALLPENLNEQFTVKDLAGAMKINRPLAQKIAYCFRKANVFELIGKQGNAYLYRIIGNY